MATQNKMITQEWFGSKDSQRRLVRILKSSGFDKIESWKRAYRTNGVVIDIQDARENIYGHKSSFVIELNIELEQLREGHPLFEFFQRLYDPIVYGSPDGHIQKYSIDDYLR